MENVEVEILHSSLVQPSSPSPQPSLFLSAIDLLMRDIGYNRRVLFYERPASANGEEDQYDLFISTLRRSLSQVLAYFYPLAGRFTGGIGDGRLAVACNDLGVEFVEARIRGVSFTELESSNFLMQPYFEQLTRWASYSSKLHEGSAPLFSVQVTRFPCGKIAMGISHSHVLADGFSLWHFMSSWAECARGESLSLFPSHDRTILKVENPSHEKACFDVFEDSQVFQIQKIKEQRVFSFTKEMITILKERTNNEHSAYEVLCAHIWKKASKAHGHARDVRIGFGNVVNMRGRIEPAIPLGYFGNVLYWAATTASMGDLQDEDLTTTASRIRATIQSCSNVQLQQSLHFLELYESAQLLRKAMLNDLRMRASSSPKFPVLRCDFGWGKPLIVRPVVVEENGKLVYFMGPSGLGSVDLCIALPPPCMQRLESDPSFHLELSNQQ